MLAMVLDKTIAEEQSRGIVSLSRTGHPACCYLCSYSRRAFCPLLSWEETACLPTLLPVMSHVLSAVYIGVCRRVLRVSVLWRGHSKTAVEV